MHEEINDIEICLRWKEGYCPMCDGKDQTCPRYRPIQTIGHENVLDERTNLRAMQGVLG